MKRNILAFLSLINCAFLSAQEPPSGFRIHYYYRVPYTSTTSTIHPDKNLLKLLKKDHCTFLDSISFIPEMQNGYDSIWNANKSYSVHSFFIHNTEVSNAEYAEFLKTHTAPSYYPDTTVWKKPGSDEDHPYVHYYFQHKAFSNYPAVGINHWQAVQFCKWKQEELQKKVNASGIKNYRVTVDLPTEAEWQSAYASLIPKWTRAQKTAKGLPAMAPNSSAFVLGSTGYRANFGGMVSQRQQNLRLPFYSYMGSNGIPEPCNSNTSVYGVYNLLGNAAEWTSTSAQGKLYNTEQFIYTFSDKLIPNVITPTDSAALSERLHDSAAMSRHFAVKGGSWNEEFFYLQPAAVQFRDQMYRSSALGFRYVVRLVWVD